jgi:4-amino-4-deoxy-L-arabinose transferase-like glycosyltransferase
MAIEYRARVIGRGSAWVAALPGGVLATLALFAQLTADPAAGVGFSGSPWTDEGWSVLGARNLVLLGTWVTDDLAMFLVQLPYNVAIAAAFEVFGVGIAQARAVSVILSVGAVGILSILMARAFGRAAGVVSGLALASSALFLYYGRLAYLEPMVALLLVAGAALFLLPGGRARSLAGVAAGACLALAIGTKPSAGAAVIGLLVGGVVAAGSGAAFLRQRGLVVAGVIGLAGIGWLLLIGLPHREAVETAFRFWPQQLMPDGLVGWVVRIGRYVRASDGANTLALPLYLGAAAGLWLAASRWRTLELRQRALIGAAVGWVAMGLLFIVVAAYRPNRYVVPLLPGLAILVGAGVAVALERWPGRRDALRMAGVPVVGLLAVPGLVLWAGWMGGATRELPGIQAEIADFIGGGAAIEGGQAPTLAMRAPVPTIVSQAGNRINDGDLYEDHGVRWLVADETYVPAWADRHADAWARRETIRCYRWGADLNECLIKVP